VTSGGAELSGKTFQLLTEVAPGVKRIAVLWNPENPIQPVVFREAQVAAEAKRLQIQSVGVSDPAELDRALATMNEERPGALLVLQDLMLQAHLRQIVDFATRSRLPAMYERKAWVDAGGLMSYGVSFPDNFRRAATYVDRILKGAKPGDLPVEQPTKFELVINLKTAKAIGLTIPAVTAVTGGPNNRIACSTNAANSCEQHSASPGFPSRCMTAPSGRYGPGSTPGPASVASLSA
jgi:putative ABC transport system substrate-binding protein